MPITECHNLDDIMTSQSIVILNMSKNHAFLVVSPHAHSLPSLGLVWEKVGGEWAKAPSTLWPIKPILFDAP